MIGAAENNAADGRLKWLCQCSCGSTTAVIGRDLINGRTTRCRRCATVETVSKYKTLPVEQTAANAVLGAYKRSAKKRGFTWNLPRSLFDLLLKSNCYYCGEPPSNKRKVNKRKGGLAYNGIDRVNNFKNYTPGNVVPCCRQCNRWKSQMSADEFLTTVCKIAARIEGRGIMNQVFLSGRLGKDPEITKTSSGKTVGKFSLAVKKFKSDEVDWFNIVSWEKQAELAGKYLKKGSKVLIQGQIEFNEYKEKTYTNIVAHQIEFLDSKAEDTPKKSAPRSEEIGDSDLPF